METGLAILGVLGTWLALFVGSSGGAYIGARSQSQHESRKKIHALLRDLGFDYDLESTPSGALLFGKSNPLLGYAMTQYAFRLIYDEARLLRRSDRALFAAVALEIPRGMCEAAYEGSILVEMSLSRPGVLLPEVRTQLQHQAANMVNSDKWRASQKNLDQARYRLAVNAFRKHLEYHLGVPTCKQRFSYSARLIRSWRGWGSLLRDDIVKRRANPVVAELDVARP